MEKAIIKAKEAASIGEVPVGAVLVRDDKIIASSHNSNIADINPISHAEMNTLISGSIALKNHRLIGTSLYVTLEPCAMCLGAIIHSRISRVVFGAFDKKTGACGSCFNLLENNCFNHRPELLGGVLEEKCAAILKNFFLKKRF